MESQKEEISTEKKIIDGVKKEAITIDNNTLSMNELIERVNLLSKNKKPYSVSKEIEEIKSIFYIKLQSENKEKIQDKNLDNEENNIRPKLHPLEIKFKAVFNTYRKIKSEFRKNKEAEEKKNLKIKKEIIKDIYALSKEEESLKITFEKFRVLQKKWKDTGYVPITENNHLWQSYHHHVELFYDFIKLNNDLRDLDFKRNLEEKKDICNKAQALLQENSINKAHNSLQELHEHWKNIGPVERKQREPIWEKFQTISRKINKKRNDYFIERKKQDSIKLKEKNIITKAINNLSSEERTSHNQWQEATKKCKKLEKKWRDIGSLNTKFNKLAWQNLKDALNNFYRSKNTFYKQQKKTNQQTLENKLTICKKAESLQNSTNWKATTKEFITLQEEWKNSGFSPARQSNELWKRFKIACDTFFDSRKAFYKENEKEKEALLKELKELKSSSDSKKELHKLKEFNLRWNNLALKTNNKTDINAQFLKLLNTKFTKLGLNKKELAIEQYKNKISSLKGNKKAISSEQQFIRNNIASLKKEITQYENNISFFGNGKSTEPLVKQAQQKIDNIKADIEDLKQKIQLLNKA